MLLRKPLFYFSIALQCWLAGVVVPFALNPDKDEQIALDATKRIEQALGESRREFNEFVAATTTDKPFSNYYFVAQRGEITRWSTHSFVPDLNTLTDDSLQFLKNSRGEYLVRRNDRDGRTELTVIPLRERFRVTNRYLGPKFNADIFGSSVSDIVPLQSRNGIPVVISGLPLFEIVAVNTTGRSLPSLWLFGIGCLAAVLFITLVVQACVAKRKFGRGFLLLILGGGLLRIGMISVGFPGAWASGALFDPLIFASSSFNPSLSDLVLNSVYVLAVCFYLFRYFFRFHFVKSITSQKGIIRWMLTVLVIVVSFFGFLYPFLFFETIAHNSAIDLDWTRVLTFDGPRAVAFISILMGLLSSFLFCHVTLKLASHLVGPDRGGTFLAVLGLGGVLFWAYSQLIEQDYSITLLTGAAMFVSGYFGAWDRSLERVTFFTFIYFLSVISFQSLQGAFVVKQLEEERTRESMLRFGANYLVGRDVLGEYLLSEAAGRIAADPFIQTRLANPLFGKSAVRQKVSVIYLSSYFDRYETQVHLFSPTGDPLDAASIVDFASFIERYQQEADATGYRGIYFVDPASGDLSKKYVSIIPVHRGARTVGFIAIAMTQKRIAPRQVYPRLLVDNRFAGDSQSTEFSYSVFQNDSLISSSGEMKFTSGSDGDLASSMQVVIEGEGGRRAVVRSGAYPFFRVIANLCFWILLGVSTIAVWLLVRGVQNIRTPLRLTYAARIQLFVFLAFLIPLVTVTITTLNWTSRSAKEQLDADFRSRAEMLGEQVTPALMNLESDSTDIGEFENYFSEVARLAGLDASLYATNGKLMATNQPLIFDNQILSRWINPAVSDFESLNAPTIVDESVGALEYSSVYYALRSPQTAQVVGVLGIPFFESAYSLEQEQITILANISIIFVATLLLFSLFSFVAVRWLTFPLQMITKSLSSMSLKRENRLLEWNSNDEIGLMVQEYNRMVLNLEKSKIDLARSQKESAWREMAQQVAHEIKNPLTPMKLTIQQMEWALKKGDLSREKTEKSVETLLTQLEILNDIATSFSTFAKMPAPNLERVEMHGLIKKVVDLYAGHPLGRVEKKIVDQPVFILGDDQLLSRILSNLILNGLQSGDEGVVVNVRVRTAIENGVLRIFVEDTGKGIDESLKEKVFIPHFTTKKSGSGLGLAIAKQGIEQCGGSISFQANHPVGTVFVVEFPLA